MTTQSKKLRILLIEDDPNYFVLLNERLLQCNAPAFEVVRSKMLQSGIDRLKLGDIDIILLDLTLPDSSGLNSLTAVRHASPQTPVVILTGVDDRDLASNAISQGAQDYLVKGSFDRELLNKSILYAFNRHQAQAELQSIIRNTKNPRVLIDKEERFKASCPISGAVYRYSLNASVSGRSSSSVPGSRVSQGCRIGT